MVFVLHTPSWSITGDLDKDRDVDFDDFFLFSDNFGKTGSIDVSDCGDEITTTPLTFTGDGTQTTGQFQLENGLRVVRVTKSTPTESIIVTMLDGTTGETFHDGFIADLDDKNEVSKSFQVETTNTYVINVTTGGEWTVTLDSGEDIPSIPSGNTIEFSGDGTQTTGSFTLDSGLRVIRVTKTQPTESIIVTMLNGTTGDTFHDGFISDLDDLSEVSKSFQVESDEVGEYVLNVNTGGGWTITIE